MSEEDRHRWEQKHRTAPPQEEPSPFLVDQIVRVPQGGTALDVAAGRGRNSVFLARHGFSVDAMDISPTAVGEVNRLATELGLPLNGIQTDLDAVNLPASRYELVIVINYLNRSLIPKLKTALKPGGYVIYETFLVDQKEIGHPTNPLYLLEHNELLDLFREFRTLFYREGMFVERGESRFVASLFAKKWRRPGEGRA